MHSNTSRRWILAGLVLMIVLLSLDTASAGFCIHDPGTGLRFCTP